MQSKMDEMSVCSIMGSPFSDPDEVWENLSHKHDRARYNFKWSSKSHIDLKSLLEHKIYHKTLVSTEFIKVKDESALSEHHWALLWYSDLQMQEWHFVLCLPLRTLKIISLGLYLFLIWIFKFLVAFCLHFSPLWNCEVCWGCQCTVTWDCTGLEVRCHTSHGTSVTLKVKGNTPIHCFWACTQESPWLPLHFILFRVKQSIKYSQSLEYLGFDEIP